jgi:hypothetical protein
MESNGWEKQFSLCAKNDIIIPQRHSEPDNAMLARALASSPNQSQTRQSTTPRKKWVYFGSDFK